MKQCVKCKKSWSRSNFNKMQRSKDGLNPRCKPCVRAYSNKRNREKLSGPDRERQLRMRRNAHLKRKYGLTLEDYEKLLKKQGGVCAICGCSPEDTYQSLSVDHCHDSGKIRELLCEPCNKGIGMFKENIPRIKKAIAYIEKHS